MRYTDSQPITDQQHAIMLELATAINQPTLAKSRAVDNWLYVVAKLLESVQSQNQQWSFGKVTLPPNASDNEFAATVTFTCKGVSVAGELGVAGPVSDSRIWLGFAGGRRVVDQNRIEITSSTSELFPMVVAQVKRQIREAQMDVARNGRNLD